MIEEREYELLFIADPTGAIDCWHLIAIIKANDFILDIIYSRNESILLYGDCYHNKIRDVNKKFIIVKGFVEDKKGYKIKNFDYEYPTNEQVIKYLNL